MIHGKVEIRCIAVILGTSHDGSLLLERFEYNQSIDQQTAQTARQSGSRGPFTAGTVDRYHDDSGLSQHSCRFNTTNSGARAFPTSSISQTQPKCWRVFESSLLLSPPVFHPPSTIFKLTHCKELPASSHCLALPYTLQHHLDTIQGHCTHLPLHNTQPVCCFCF